MAVGELPFRGASRKRLVDELVERFEQVRAQKKPFFVLLEAESGWGKTRLVHEFYRRLAADQSDPAYWPASIIEALPASEQVGAEDEASVRRKRVYPSEVNPPKGAKPAWFWWGISCGKRNGSPLSSLDQDFRQILDHREALARTLRLDARISKMVKSKDFWETFGQEAIGAAAGVPGLGLLLFGAKYLRSGIAGSAPSGATSAMVLADELAASVGAFAKDGIPVVIAIEDLQLADEALVELIKQVVEDRIGPVLVIATVVAGERSRSNAKRLDAEVSVSLRELWDLDETAGHLDLEDRVALVDELLPAAGRKEREALARRYEIPYLLELACADGRVRDLVNEGKLTEEAIQKLPRSVEAFWTRQFEDMDRDVQEAFMLSVLSAPAGIANLFLGRGGRIWDRDLSSTALEGLHWASAAREALIARLDEEATARSWIRSVGEWLRACHEPGRFDLVRGLAMERYGDSGRQADFWARLGPSLGDASSESDVDRRRVLAQVLAALALEGVTDWSPQAIAAADLLIDESLSAFDTNSLQLVETLGRAVIDADPLRVSHRLHKVAQALEGRGQTAEAVQLLREAISSAGSIAGQDPPPSLALREALAYMLRRVGRLRESQEAFTVALDQSISANGPDHETTFRIRGGLAATRGDAGDTVGAAEEFSKLVEARTRLAGAGDPTVFAERKTLLSWLLKTERLSDAVAGAKDLVRDCEASLGEDHPITLGARGTLAECLAEAMAFEEADLVMNTLIDRLIDLYEDDAGKVLEARVTRAVLRGRAGDKVGAADELGLRVDALSRTLGADHPHTLSERCKMLSWLRDTDKRADAVVQLRSLLEECAALLGDMHPTTFRVSEQLAAALRDEELFEEAIRVQERAVEARTRLQDAESDDLLEAISLLTELRGLHGDAQGAAEDFKWLSREFARLCGPESPQALKQRQWQVIWQANSGDLQGAAVESRRLVEDCERALGPNHQVTLAARAQLSHVHRHAQAREDAVGLFERLVEQHRDLEGSEYPLLLGLRADLANARRTVGDESKAVADLEQLIVDREQFHGEADQRTLRQRMVLMDALCGFGRLDEAIEGALNLVDDCMDVLGESHFVTREALDVLANSYARAERFAEEVAIRLRIAGLVSQRGVAHAETIWARRLLARAYHRAGNEVAAAEEFLALISVLSAARGASHEETEAARRSVVVWLGEAKLDPEALAVAGRLLTECESALGDEHPTTRDMREALGRAKSSADA